MLSIYLWNIRIQYGKSMTLGSGLLLLFLPVKNCVRCFFKDTDTKRKMKDVLELKNNNKTCTIEVHFPIDQ